MSNDKAKKPGLVYMHGHVWIIASRMGLVAAIEKQGFHVYTDPDPTEGALTNEESEALAKLRMRFQPDTVPRGVRARGGGIAGMMARLQTPRSPSES